METRIKRYSRKNRIKRKIKKMGFWKMIRFILKNLNKEIIYLTVGTIYLTYTIFKCINNVIASLFMMFPRIVKVTVIYLLIINTVINFSSIFNNNTIKKYEVKALSITSVKSLEQENNGVEEQKEEICIFDSVSCKIHKVGQKIGLNEEQILISIAISRWETGNYTSKAFLEKNNVGGMMCSSGLINYSSLEEGIEKFLLNLRDNYFNIGLDTIEKIQPKYCPVGAANDPNGLNKHWLSGVTNMYNELRSSK